MVLLNIAYISTPEKLSIRSKAKVLLRVLSVLID